MIEIEDLLNGTFAIVERGENLAFCDSSEQAERIKRALERESLKFLVFAARDEQAKEIEDVLNLADVRFAEADGNRTHTLVAVLTDWRNRVTTAEHLAKVDAEGPPGMDDPRTQMHLRLDEDDCLDIIKAVERRNAWDCAPDSDSCELGGMIAEICRGWMERVEHDTQPQPRRTDNGDGTVTFHGVDVTVPAKTIEGRDVLAVKVPKKGETIIHPLTGVVIETGVDFCDHEIRIILGPKPEPPAPQFEAGKCYRSKHGGAIVGPIKGRDDMHAADWDTLTSLLEPGEVIVWRHPGLRAGEYTWSKDGVLRGGGFIVVHGSTKCYLSSWTDPPRAGRWKVVDGQEYATWEGE